jgi:hypothetical protein
VVCQLASGGLSAFTPFRRWKLPPRRYSLLESLSRLALIGHANAANLTEQGADLAQIERFTCHQSKL